MRARRQGVCRGAGLGTAVVAALVLALAGSGTASAALTTPGTPRPFAATAGDGAVTLTWGAGSREPAGYHVWRLGADGEWIRIATTPESTLTYLDTGVSNGIGYTYGVRAFNDQGVSASSTLVTVAPVGAPAPPPRCGPSHSRYGSLISSTPGLAGHWRLGERAGTLSACEMTGRNPGTFRGGPTLGATGGLAGDPDTATRFNGSPDHVSVPSSPSLALGDSFSVEAWVKRASLNGNSNQVIASKQDGSWVLMFSPQNRLVLRRSNYGDVAAASVAVSDTVRWHHVVATKAGTSVRLYIDGVNVTGPVTNRTMVDNTKPLVIGQSSETAHFRGTIDEVAVYAGALTPSQVTEHYRAGSDPVIAAAGDIACSPADPSFNAGLGTATECHQRHTSDLLVNAGLAAVLPLGDTQYYHGTLADYLASYQPSWGRVKAISRPAPGNHEYETPGAAGYFDYFNGVGAATGPAGDRTKGYYSWNVGGWHMIALNSECAHIGGCEAGSPQELWLRADLAANPARCTLAYWHRPRFSSGYHGNATDTGALWQALYEANADVVLAGHSHSYERFAPQDPTGAVDLTRGIREFVVGTGGEEHQSLGMIQRNSESLSNATFGVFKLQLHSDAYDWQFVPEAGGGGFTDSGSAACH